MLRVPFCGNTRFIPRILVQLGTDPGSCGIHGSSQMEYNGVRCGKAGQQATMNTRMTCLFRRPRPGRVRVKVAEQCTRYGPKPIGSMNTLGNCCEEALTQLSVGMRLILVRVTLTWYPLPTRERRIQHEPAFLARTMNSV